MNLTSEELKIISTVKYQPSISLILSVLPAISLKEELKHKLKTVSDNVKRQLQKNYSDNEWESVFEKVQQVITDLDYSAVKKSIAIFVSPVLTKVFHLDIPVEDKIIIDESFEIRDLVYAKQAVIKYIILLLTGKHAKLFLADNSQLIKLKLNVPVSIEAYRNDAPERVSNFTEPEIRNEIVQEKFLRNIDRGLSEILKTHDLPVFLLGTDSITGEFKKLSVNTDNIADTIHGNYEGITVTELHHAVSPFYASLKKRRNKSLLDDIEKAMNSHKLEMGINAVWKAVQEQPGRLLVVENNYVYPADRNDKTHIHQHNTENTSPFYIKDAVDDVIEKVIQNGGEVVFVDEGLLKDYMQIVLIRYY